MMAEAFVIGSGPNGLTAAIVLARAGLHTTMFEAQPTVGGGTRSAELIAPGVIHDICSAVHPLAVASPAFASFPLTDFGLDWIHPPIAVAHPLDDGSAAIVTRSLEETAKRLGPDGPIYRGTIEPFVARWAGFIHEILRPLHWPSSPLLLARFGALAMRSAASAARRFRTPAARALFAGLAAHSTLPLEAPGSAAFGWMLAAAAHAVGWPIPRGGSQHIANVLASYFESLGGTIITGTRIGSLDDLPETGLILCDVTPRQFLAIAGNRLPEKFSRKLAHYRYGPGVFKMDWILSAPTPWRAAECALAGTVHLGGSFEEIALSEQAPVRGETVASPFVLLAQPSLFDPTRTGDSRQTVWAYCHVPNGSTVDMTDRIEAQIERFAPGFRSRIVDIVLFANQHDLTPEDEQQFTSNTPLVRLQKGSINKISVSG